MPSTPIHHLARTAYTSLQSGTPPAEVADALSSAIAELNPADRQTFLSALQALLTEDGLALQELVLDTQRFLIELGMKVNWSEIVVSGAQAIVHILIDVTRDYPRAIAEFARIEKLLRDSDLAAWALLVGDIGIAHLHLGNTTEAIKSLAVPVALTGPLFDPPDTARYLGNMGAWLAGEGLRYAARIAVASANEQTNDPELLEKFTSDLRRLGGAG